MSDPSDHTESIKIAHLTMIQGVIARMGSNSFTLKALSATFASAAVAVMATVQTPSPYYLASALVPIIIFWMMDAQYLRYERSYRKLYDHVRSGESIDPYSLDASPFLSDIPSIIRISISWSVSLFYIAIILSLLSVAGLIFHGS